MPDTAFIPEPNIESLRKGKGLTQRELADKVGVTETTIANWETGRRGLEWIIRIKNLCEALDCQVGDLVKYTHSLPDGHPPSYEELLAAWEAGSLHTKK